MKVVIIGGGSAGVSAATHLRRNDEQAEIIIVERSDEFALSSCGLPYVLAGKIKDGDDLVGATPEQMEKVFNIKVRLNTEVLTIEPDSKQIVLSGNEKLNYDKLIIAAGGMQLRPDIAGVLSDTVFTLNNLYSAQRIADYFYGLEAKNILILGGGHIGLRAAEALSRKKAKITIVDNASHILSDADYDFASMIKQKLEAKGINILTNTTVKEFLPDKAVLSNGTKIKYDIAIIATGSKSEVRLPIMADIDIGTTGGIVVDASMQTSIKDILACGDNVETKDLITNLPLRIGNAALVVRSAKTAADTICGIPAHFGAALNNQIVKVFDYTIGICGCNEDMLKRAGIAYHKLYFSQAATETYTENYSPLNIKLLFGIDGTILGLQIFGKTGVETRLNTTAAIMQRKGSVQELAEFPMAYSPEFAKAKDVLNNIGSLASAMVFDKLKVSMADDLTEKDILLNVCSPAQFKYFSRAQSIDIPLADLRAKIKTLPKDKKIVLACASGYASYLAYCILTQRGFDNIFLLNAPEVWQ